MGCLGQDKSYVNVINHLQGSLIELQTNIWLNELLEITQENQTGKLLGRSVFTNVFSLIMTNADYLF